MKVKYEYTPNAKQFNDYVSQAGYLEDDEDWVSYLNFARRHFAGNFKTQEERSAFMKGIALGFEAGARPFKREETLVA